MIITYYELQELAGDKWRSVPGKHGTKRLADHAVIKRTRAGHKFQMKVATIRRITKGLASV